MILLSEKSSVRHLVQAGLVSAKVPLRMAAEVKSMITAVNMVRLGLGVTVLPWIALPSLNMQGLQASMVELRARRAKG